MTDEIKTLQDKYKTVANQIEYQLEQFYIEGSLHKKKIIIEDIKILVDKLKDYVL